MDRISLSVSALIGSFVALVLSEFVLFRAAWELPSDIDRGAFLIRIGSGPSAGLVTLAYGAIALWACRILLRRFFTQAADGSHQREPRAQRKLISHAAICGIRGIVAGLGIGALAAWVLIRLDAMGNGGDTSIVHYEFRDFVEVSLLGMGLCLAAALSLPQRFATTRPATP